MKKLLILSFCAVILLSVVSGSIAFFTDSVQTSNVITSGSIDIAQHEYERKKLDGAYTAELQEYTQAQTILPCVQIAPVRQDVTVTIPEKDIQQTMNLYVSGMNNFVDKIITVENEGKNYASVRTFIAVPATAEGVSWIHLDKNTAGGWEWLAEDAMLRGQVIEGKTYNIHVATNLLPLAPGAITEPSLLGFYLDSQFTSKNGSYFFNGVDLGSDPEMSILVATEVTQALGYRGDEDVLNQGRLDAMDNGVFTGAHHALDTVFGAPAEHHPWQPAEPENP